LKKLYFSNYKIYGALFQRCKKTLKSIFMKNENYWVKFWQQNSILSKPTPHEKVGRTIGGVPIRDDDWAKVLKDLEKRLSLNRQDDLLDIGAGSGVISIPFSKKVKTTTAVDISEKLLEEMEGIKDIKTIRADVRDLTFGEESFSKIIIYSAIQHFTEEESAALMQKAYGWLRPGGIFYIGDAPDIERRFAFFNSPDRVNQYLQSLINQTPSIGTWFHRDFFNYLGKQIGFSEVDVIKQPENYIFAHWRYDVFLKK
jgi:cyclopropane fatty-acyl-phospholipid synthase-like methyltransferase